MRSSPLLKVLTWPLRAGILVLVASCARTPPPMLPAERAWLKELHVRGIRATDADASQGPRIGRYRASNLMAPAGGLDWGLVRVNGAPGPGRHDNGVSIRLRGPMAVDAGDPIALTVDGRNMGSTPVTMVRPPDGSHVEGIRLPRYTLYVAELEHRRTFRLAFIGLKECDAYSLFDESKLVEILPGTTMPIIPNWGEAMPNVRIGRPGRYALWLTYGTSFKPEEHDEGDSDSDSDRGQVAQLGEPWITFEELTMTSNAHVIWVE